MEDSLFENLNSGNTCPERMFHAYILVCSDDTLYTGWTRDIEKRIETHNTGEGAKYTRTRRPVKLLASWSFDNKREAMRMEYKIKRMNRTKKLALAAEQSAETYTTGVQ